MATRSTQCGIRCLPSGRPAWPTVTCMRGAFRVDRGQVLIDSLARASVATDQDRRNIDLAQLLTLSALALGTDEALAIADRRLGSADLASIVPYLQKAALGPRLREATAKAHFGVDDLRARAAAKAEIEAPKMAAIRRVSTRTLVQAGLLAAAAYFLISTLAGVDINQVLDALRTASLPTLFLALIVGQLPRFAYAESTRAACPRHLPYGPPVLLQFSVTFINLVFPSTVARMALNVRFFQRQGIPPASAVSIGLIENLAGLVVEIFIIVAVVVFGFNEIDVDLQASSQPGRQSSSCHRRDRPSGSRGRSSGACGPPVTQASSGPHPAVTGQPPGHRGQPPVSHQGGETLIGEPCGGSPLCQHARAGPGRTGLLTVPGHAAGRQRVRVVHRQHDPGPGRDRY